MVFNATSSFFFRFDVTWFMVFNATSSFFFRFDVAWFMVFNATSSFFLGLMWLGLWCLMPLQVFF